MILVKFQSGGVGCGQSCLGHVLCVVEVSIGSKVPPKGGNGGLSSAASSISAVSIRPSIQRTPSGSSDRSGTQAQG